MHSATQSYVSTPVTLSFSFKMEFDFPTLIEIVAGIHASRGNAGGYSKRELVAAIKDRVIEVGRTNLNGWRAGLPQDQQAKYEDWAVNSLVHGLRGDLFPMLASTAHPSYQRRLDAWIDTLDPLQKAVYSSGALPAFSQRGRAARQPDLDVPQLDSDQRDTKRAPTATPAVP